ncbi:reverse transcriptase family protein [Bacillus cereus]|nr:reverse transcriptase family protein [Bacillus cereus]
MCRTYDEAQRFYHATVDFLKSRLGLEINPKKSKVVNLKKNSSVFLGFKIKVVKQGKAKFGYIAKPVCPTKLLQKLKDN